MLFCRLRWRRRQHASAHNCRRYSCSGRSPCRGYNNDRTFLEKVNTLDGIKKQRTYKKKKHE